jgi:hypothetical protein
MMDTNTRRQETDDNKIHVLACWVTAGSRTTVVLAIFANLTNLQGKLHVFSLKNKESARHFILTSPFEYIPKTRRWSSASM